MVRKIRYNRPKTSPPERLIDFLCSRFPYLTRRAWEEHIHDGYVTVVTAMVTSSGGGGPVHCGQLMPSDYELQQKDEVHFNPPRELEPEVDETVVTIYSDNVIVVCIKNGNLPVAEGGRYSLNTLVGLLQRKNLLTKVDGCGSGGGVSAANSRGDKGSDSTCAYFPVHRLDKETSGLVVLAKTQDAARFLSLLFERQTELLSAEVGKGMEAQCFDSPAVLSWFEGLLAMDKTVVKSYIALLQGEAPEGSCFVVTDRIGLLWDEVRENVTESEKHVKLKKLKMACYPSLPTKPQQHGRPACSRVRILTNCAILGVSLARVDILTGKTHQIRLHCAQIGYPVLGDKLYETATPGVVGGCRAVDDDVYLRRAKERLGMSWGLDGLFVRRHLLHAALLSFIHPTTKEKMEFYAPPRQWFLADILQTEASREALGDAKELFHSLVERGMAMLEPQS